MNAVTKPATSGDIMAQVIAKGDLAKLSPDERNQYYSAVCTSIGLNPLTQPFEYISLNGKLRLYAKRDAADQLRKINGISIQIIDKSVQDGLMTVHVRAVDKTGRQDEDLGVVSIGGLKGEGLANAILKTITKAKRRVTLSISGLGFLDETEVADIPASAKAFPAMKDLHEDQDVIDLQVPIFTDYFGEVTQCKSKQEFLDLFTAALESADIRQIVDGIWETNSGYLTAMRPKDASGTQLGLEIDQVHEEALNRTKPNFWAGATLALNVPGGPDAWVKKFISGIEAAPSQVLTTKLWEDNKNALDALDEAAYQRCNAALDKRMGFWAQHPTGVSA